MRKYFLVFLLFSLPVIVFAQSEDQNEKGKFFAYWGYNRAWYSTSDIHLKGRDYHFTIYSVEAKDRPSKFSFHDYVSPQRIWIPQYNYRVGYFFHKNYSISLGLDHMKYVMIKNQELEVSGTIDSTRSKQYQGNYNKEKVVIAPDFLLFEHTDGLNYLSIDLDRYDQLFTIKNKFRFYLSEGLNAGPVIPRTDVRLFTEGLNNKFHLAGLGAGLKAGLHITVFEKFFVRSDVKYGYITLPNVLTTGKKEDRANHHFTFFQYYIVVGVNFNFPKKL